jgi:hypothetical protein
VRALPVRLAAVTAAAATARPANVTRAPHAVLHVMSARSQSAQLDMPTINGRPVSTTTTTSATRRTLRSCVDWKKRDPVMAHAPRRRSPNVAPGSCRRGIRMRGWPRARGHEAPGSVGDT